MAQLKLVTGNLPEDDEIKVLAATDRAAAVDWVVRKYRDRLFRHACYVLKDYERAADVTQEVFIKAIRERRFFEPDFKMKAWLFRVTSNLCFNIVRDRKRRGAILQAFPRPKSTEAKQVEVVLRSQEQRSMLEAMDELSRNHREILMLRYYSDLSYAEIATSLQIKLGTVMSRLSRAKHQLMEVLASTRVEQADGDRCPTALI